MPGTFVLKNKTISIYEFVKILESKKKVQINSSLQKKLRESEKFLNSLLKQRILIYGINTGYGPLANVHIPLENAKELQKNLIYHLSTGVGDSLSEIHIKALMLARILCLSKGYSAIRNESFEILLNFYNMEIFPLIPKLGTVGASGDLTPLSHMTLALMGESKVKYKGKIYNSRKILKDLNIKPLVLGPKEGLAFVNGTSVMTGVAAVNGIYSIRALDFAISLSILYAEIFEAKIEAFDPRIGKLKPQLGIKKILEIFDKRSASSKRFKAKPSKSNSKSSLSYENEFLQDVYSIRCIPQILGAIDDSIQFHNRTVEIELNSISDNPVFLSNEKVVLHGGNFQGTSIALASDALYNALTNLVIHSERKIAKITDAKLNNGLPPFLQGNKNGLHSGFMGAQVTATAILAWIRSNSIPSSIQSISTNANNQDVVSMGTIAAIKTAECLDRVFDILAIEAMVMAQAFELKNGFDKNAGFSRNSIQFVKNIRRHSSFLFKDRSLSEEIQTLGEKMKSGLL